MPYADGHKLRSDAAAALARPGVGAAARQPGELFRAYLETTDLDDGSPYPIITGDYSRTPAWERRPVTVGAKVEKPTPIFTKLDPSVVDDELARLG